MVFNFKYMQFVGQAINLLQPPINHSSSTFITLTEVPVQSKFPFSQFPVLFKILESSVTNKTSWRESRVGSLGVGGDLRLACFVVFTLTRSHTTNLTFLVFQTSKKSNAYICDKNCLATKQRKSILVSKIKEFNSQLMSVTKLNK